MNLTTYRQKALRTDFADYSDFHSGDASPRLDYAVTGLVTEAAKALDIVKKSKKGERPLDLEGIKTELGDLLWYMNLTLDELGSSFEEIMDVNLKKIERKHPEGDPLIRGDHTS